MKEKINLALEQSLLLEKIGNMMIIYKFEGNKR